MPDSASGVLNVSVTSRDQMTMTVEYGLAGSLACIHTNVVTNHLRIRVNDLMAYFLKEAITGVDL